MSGSRRGVWEFAKAIADPPNELRTHGRRVRVDHPEAAARLPHQLTAP
jgi:hypothetical protein